MREIKFRAWDEKKKEMHGFWDMHFFSIEADWIGHPNLCFGERIIGNPTEENIIHNIEEAKEFAKRFKVMQFTGLKDKNGKEIYEGDIVENVVEGNGVIYFSNIIGGFLVKRNKISTCINAKEVFNDKFSDMIMISRDEVIGNIYENPTLVKVVE